MNTELDQLLLFSAQKVLSLSFWLQGLHQPHAFPREQGQGTVWGESCGSLPFFVAA